MVLNQMVWDCWTSSGNTTTGHKLTADLDTKSYGVSLGYVF